MNSTFTKVLIYSFDWQSEMYKFHHIFIELVSVVYLLYSKQRLQVFPLFNSIYKHEKNIRNTFQYNVGKVNTTTNNLIIHIYSNEHLSESVNKNCALHSS